VVSRFSTCETKLRLEERRISGSSWPSRSEDQTEIQFRSSVVRDPLSLATPFEVSAIIVSPTLACLIRKSADKEMSGASAKDALLTAAGVQPGEVATLQRELQQASEESKRWREKAAREHGQLE
jgi:hypothetical protein